MRRALPWLTGILFVTCLGLVALTLQLRRELARSRLELADFLSTRQQDRRELSELRTKLTSRPAPKPEKEKVDVPAPPESEAEENSPGMQAMLRREERREMLRMYGNAFASLNLSPEKLAALKNLLGEMPLSGTDAFEAARAAGIEPGTPAFQHVMEQTAAGVQKEIEALIGADGWATLQHAASLSIYQGEVQNTYAPDFEDASVPLTDDQKKGLAQLLSEARNPASRVPGSFKPDPQTWLSPSDQNLLTQAGQILSPAQVGVLKDDLASQQRDAAASPDGGQTTFSTVIVEREEIGPSTEPGTPSP